MDPEILKWMQDARKLQNSFCNFLGTREYDEVDAPSLTNKIGFAMYGNPVTFSEEQLELIIKIKEKITSQSQGRIFVAVLYVLIKLKSNNKGNTEVVFRIPLDGKELTKGSIFIDSSARVYKSWNDYLETNKLPKCNMCWPREGKYSKDDNGGAKIKFGESNACSVKKTIVKVADVTSMAANLGVTGVLGATLFTPVSLPIMFAAAGVSVVAGVYDAGRHISKLTDLKEHEESLTSPKALLNWFGVLSSGVCVISSGTNAVVKTAEKFGAKNISKIINIFNMSSLCMNGVSAFSGMVNIIVKAFSGSLSESDIFTFIGYCLLLFNAVIETKELAARMIRQICYSSISLLSHASNKCISVVNKMLHVSQFSENYMTLINLIIGVPVQFLVGIVAHKIECTVLKIQELKIIKDFKKYAQHVSEALQEFFNVCKENFQDILNMVNKWRFPFNPKLLTAFFKNGSGRNLPQPLNIQVFHDMLMIVKNLAEKCSVGQSEEQIKKKELIIMRQVSYFDSLKPAENLTEYFFKVKCFSKFLEKRFDSFKEEYEIELDVEALTTTEDFDLNKFHEDNDIEGNVNEHYFKKSIEIVNKEYQKLQDRYEQMPKEASCKNIAIQDVKYESVFPFCYPPNITYLTHNEYFSYATDFVGFEVNEKTSILFKEGPLVVLSPLLESQVPQVLFYKPEQFSSNEEHQVGIAVVQKSNSKPDDIPINLTLEGLQL